MCKKKNEWPLKIRVQFLEGQKLKNQTKPQSWKMMEIILVWNELLVFEKEVKPVLLSA